MTRSPLETTPLAEIVRRDFRAGAILDRYYLDFCCGGALTLSDACRQRGIPTARVIADIEALEPTDPTARPGNPAALIAHIVERHHTYVRQSLPLITEHLEKVVAAHGTRHPELGFIQSEFSKMADELSQHLLKEEQVLFPYVAALASAVNDEGPLPPDIFGTVQNPIRMMEIEHEEASDRIVAIRQLTDGFRPPPDACNTYRLLLRELEAFERDLRVHVDLENNVLFPKAVELEEQAQKVTRGLKSHQWERRVPGR